MAPERITPGLALVVDDVEANRLLAAACLRRIGWTVHACAGVEEVLQQLARTTPQAMLIDVRMPTLTGTELVALLRRVPSLRGVRMVGYTAHCLPEEIGAFLQAGFDDVLGKPALLADFRRVLPDPRGPDASAGAGR